MLSCVAEGIGNVTKALEDAGMLNNTLILADNGGPIYFPNTVDFAGEGPPSPWALLACGAGPACVCGAPTSARPSLEGLLYCLSST